ncbi:MAG TPA: nucleotidyltransferase domain-containing protein [Patescibacteria group bacterium]|nr:nucleotidyltransferase domain-containing protein [Patescibacteria group bacterium]
MTNYSPQEIGTFLLTDRPHGIHGTSPEVYDQNRHILYTIGTVAARVECEQPGALLGIQLVGSRRHGTAGPLSDADVVVIANRGQRGVSNSVYSGLRGALPEFRINDDASQAWWRLVTDVPLTAEPAAVSAFMTEITTMRPQRLASLFEVGAYDTDSLRLVAAAAAAVIGDSISSRSAWAAIRRTFNEVYLGEPGQVWEKLTGRLAISSSALAKEIPSDIVEQRHAQLGLPSTVHEYSQGAQEWIELNQPRLQSAPGFALYTEVVGRVSQVS